MGTSKIEWTEQTWNPVVGCSIVSPGCTNCYAMRMAARIEAMGTAKHYVGITEKVKGKAVWTGRLSLAFKPALDAPLRRRAATKYFVNSMGDLFHEDCPRDWLDLCHAIMALGWQHTFQVLTKRPEVMRDYMRDPRTPERVCAAVKSIVEFYPDQYCDWLGRNRALHENHVRMVTMGKNAPRTLGRTLLDWPLPNVWLGTSTERQKEADERIPVLLGTPAAVRFISAEPLLGPIDLDAVPVTVAPGFFGGALGWHHRGKCHEDEGIAYPALDWVIVGGESGPGARMMDPTWAASIRDQCASAGVAYFFKQMTRKAPIPPDLMVRQFPVLAQPQRSAA